MANFLSIEKRKQIFHLFCEGNGVRVISRLTGHSVNTIAELRKRYTFVVEYFNKKYIHSLSVEEIHADEIKTFVKRADNPKWVFIAMDSKSRMVINFYIGDRSGESAKIFLSELSYKLSSKADVITDLLVSYIASVKKTPYGRIDGSVANINLLSSDPDKEMWRLNNKIEAQNGVVRQHVSSLGRKTRCFAKSDEGLRQQLVMYFFYYNFIQRHKAIKTCPAVALGLIEKPFTINILLEYETAFTKTFTHKDKINYGKVKTQGIIRTISDEDKSEFLEEIGFMDGMKKGTNWAAYGKKAKVVLL